MTDQFTIISNTLHNEFYGPSYNGQALLPLLKSLKFSSVMEPSQWEGYRVIDVVYHLVSWKYQTLTFLGASALCEVPPLPLENFPPVPDDFDENDWRFLLAYLSTLQNSVIQAIQDLAPSMMDRHIPEIDTDVVSYLSWFITHDSYHVAMIRNMGITALRGETFQPALSE